MDTRNSLKHIRGVSSTKNTTARENNQILMTLWSSVTSVLTAVPCDGGFWGQRIRSCCVWLRECLCDGVFTVDGPWEISLSCLTGGIRSKWHCNERLHYTHIHINSITNSVITLHVLYNRGEKRRSLPARKDCSLILHNNAIYETHTHNF